MIATNIMKAYKRIVILGISVQLISTPVTVHNLFPAVFLISHILCDPPLYSSHTVTLNAWTAA